VLIAKGDLDGDGDALQQAREVFEAKRLAPKIEETRIEPAEFPG